MKKEIIDKFKDYGFVYVKQFDGDVGDLLFLKMTEGIVFAVSKNNLSHPRFHEYVLNIETKHKKYPPIHFNLVDSIDKTLSIINDLCDNIKRITCDLLKIIDESGHKEHFDKSLCFMLSTPDYYAQYYNEETNTSIYLKLNICDYGKLYLICQSVSKIFTIEISGNDYHLNESQLDEFITELAFLKLG